ncbi:hypothetical protein BC829DRAFT_407358 [Chytridium lagenaria]|nr:hypothetical protein BC829DRAFT_407358 [Chytridium lagenaria]
MPLPTSHSFKALWRRLFSNSSRRRALSHHRKPCYSQLWVDRTLFAGTTVTSRWTPAGNDACDSTVLVTREQNAPGPQPLQCYNSSRVDFEKTFSTFFQLQVSNTILMDLTVDAELNYQFLFDSLDKYVFEGEYFSMMSEKIIRAVQSVVMGYDGWNDNNVMPKLQSGCLPIHKIIMEVDERRGRLNFRFSKLVWHGLKFIGATDLQKCLPLMDIIDSTAQVISRAALENVGQVDDARKWHLKCREVAVNLFLNHWLACREDEPIWDDPL